MVKKRRNDILRRCRHFVRAHRLLGLAFARLLVLVLPHDVVAISVAFIALAVQFFVLPIFYVLHLCSIFRGEHTAHARPRAQPRPLRQQQKGPQPRYTPISSCFNFNVARDALSGGC